MSSSDPSSRPDPAAIRAMIAQHVLDLPEEFAADQDLFEAGLDSMAIMQLLLHLEEDFGVRIPMGEVTRDNFATTTAIAGLVGRKLADGATTEPQGMR